MVSKEHVAVVAAYSFLELQKACSAKLIREAFSPKLSLKSSSGESKMLAKLIEIVI
jgi:hypothetical protein